MTHTTRNRQRCSDHVVTDDDSDQDARCSAVIWRCKRFGLCAACLEPRHTAEQCTAPFLDIDEAEATLAGYVSHRRWRTWLVVTRTTTIAATLAALWTETNTPSPALACWVVVAVVWGVLELLALRREGYLALAGAQRLIDDAREASQ